MAKCKHFLIVILLFVLSVLMTGCSMDPIWDEIDWRNPDLNSLSNSISEHDVPPVSDLIGE